MSDVAEYNLREEEYVIEDTSSGLTSPSSSPNVERLHNSVVSSNGVKRKLASFVAQDDVLLKKAKSADQAHKVASELVQAARTGSAVLLQQLLASGADVNVRVCGCTALQYAAFYGHLSMVHALLSKGADVNAQNYSGITALMWAVERDHVEVVRALLKGGSSCALKDNKGATALHKAVYRGSLPLVKALLEEGECNVDILAGKEGEEATSLQEACALGHSEIVLHLLEQGANPDKQSAKLRTALHRAVCGNQPAAVRVLIECGANVNLQDESERTAAHWAAFYGWKECMLALTSSGQVDWLLRDCSKKTPLDVANIRRHHQVAEVIKTRGNC